ncbi:MULTISPECIES: beta-ketoacyl synthase N-terminal-like domain-containing protein [unclassified Psychrobacter]|uniref:beta-ketoacyl synthase N-terminal-like domain-containing protein n=1 Tax=unclassified Psychrobacter TaxID=196806 RepID=UPI00078D6F79|nr:MULTISPECIES: beta-ketoacyl synthase N-terminal-like domain-containing protein [unclassified Psychrobacter]AMN50511.1 3-oxoacyl-ACP synthase [Psychrobacter sp. P2G3]AMN68405.1 3-oxoacyl-ACP synthase [Psychrobacter sp. P11G5]
MRRVVITGAGIVSCIGHDLATVTSALKQGQSGITFNETYAEHGFKSQVSGSIDKTALDTAGIDRKLKRFFSDASLYAYVSALAAIKQSGLSLETINHNPRVGVVAGSGGASTEDVVSAVDAMREKGLRGVGAMAVPKTMSSSVSAALATGLKIQGISYSISSACATSTHCIGHAAELIQLGKADVILAGGSEAEDWTQSCMFDAMGAMSTQYNDTPKQSSRAYDRDRDGFVIAGGGAMVVVESLEHAQARGANILAEIVGYGASSDGAEMVAPSGEGAVRCMQQALAQAGLERVDYVNTHGTSTPLGDITELKAIAKVFASDTDTPTKNSVPPISSTKSMTGHSLGAVGAQELIYCLLMLQEGFIAPSINIENLDEAAAPFDIVTELRETKLNTLMSNSFGFGGTNATLIIKRFDA